LAEHAISACRASHAPAKVLNFVRSNVFSISDGQNVRRLLAEWRSSLLMPALGFLLSLLAAAAVAQKPSSIADLALTPIPDAENAAWHLEQLRVPAEVFSARQQEFLDSPLGVDFQAREDRGEAPTAEQMAGMAQLVERFSMLDEGATAMAACEQYASLGDFSGDPEKFTNSLLQQITAARGMARYLDWRIRTLAAAGDAEGAMRRAIGLLRISRLVQNEPTMMGYLSGIAIRGVALTRLAEALSSGRVSFDARTTLDAELELLDDPRRFAAMMRGERAYAIASSEEQLNKQNEGGLRELAGAVGLAWTDEQLQRGMVEYFDSLIAASNEPWQEFRKRIRLTSHETIEDKYGALAVTASPGMGASLEAHERDLARARSLRIVNALAIFAVMNKREATGVSELDLPGSALLDPYSGALLKVKRKDVGWIVYSVGRDGRDNGGAFANFVDVGVGPIGPQEKP
jgi:hypothetical protein